jgi:hypothetical protein
MKSLAKPVIFFLALACLLLFFIEAARAADKTPIQSHITILGLIIGDATSQDIYSRLGPTIPIKDGVSQLCYVSDRDETLIIFTTENSQCTGVKLMSQKMKFYKWHFCEKSSPVSKHLATGSGIKLGMSKNQLKAILGPPESDSNSLLNYVFDRDRKTTIRAEFSETGMILFDVSKY